jgi:hypothetical protein
MRPKWKGSSIPIGPASCAGFAVFIAGLGAALLSSRLALLSSYTVFFILFAVSGWILAAVGGMRDKRSHAVVANPAIAEEERKRSSLSPRWIGLIIAIALGDFLFLQVRSAWTNYWLLKDGQPGMAIVTKDYWGGHNVVVYEYAVNQKHYTGRSSRSWQEPRYRNVRAGDESVVYFSASHPWLSLLNKPRIVVEGLPVVIIVLGLELFAVVTIINPRSKWAFNISDKRENHAA